MSQKSLHIRRDTLRVRKTKPCINCGQPFDLTYGSRKRCCPCARDFEKVRGRITAQVQRAIRTGILARQPCEVCGREKVDAHHDDYSLPLKVRWLCRSHHQQHHARLNRVQSPQS